MGKESFYMHDNTENKDGKIETIMDYTISWTLRRAQKCFSEDKPTLYSYSRRILGKLLNKDIDESVSVEEVKVQKQHHNIDLWIDVYLSINGYPEKHAILIENKAYSFIHNSRDEDGEYKCQLEVYKKKFDREYKEREVIKHYVLITCHEEEMRLSALMEICDKYDFKVLSLTKIQANHKEADTESDIFNEFWLRTW